MPNCPSHFFMSELLLILRLMSARVLFVAIAAGPSVQQFRQQGERSASLLPNSTVQGDLCGSAAVWVKPCRLGRGLNKPNACVSL